MTPGWDLLTNHAHVLLCVANDPGVRLREIADSVGITERSAHKIVSELVEEGYVAARARRAPQPLRGQARRAAAPRPGP